MLQENPLPPSQEIPNLHLAVTADEVDSVVALRILISDLDVETKHICSYMDCNLDLSCCYDEFGLGSYLFRS
jgi:hypothetical protein